MIFVGQTEGHTFEIERKMEPDRHNVTMGHIWKPFAYNIFRHNL
jgi:hypothetical protein